MMTWKFLRNVGLVLPSRVCRHARILVRQFDFAETHPKQLDLDSTQPPCRVDDVKLAEQFYFHHTFRNPSHRIARVGPRWQPTR